MDFNAILNDEEEQIPLALGMSGRRVKIDVSELKARLKNYEDNNPDFEATQEHLEILQAVMTDHKNVFITGGAGTGKTTFVRSVLMPELDYRNLQWAVTATTGIAGSHLEGKTLHSFFGIGLGPNWRKNYPRGLAEFWPTTPAGEPTPTPQDMSRAELKAWYEYHYDDWMSNPSVKSYVREGVMKRLRSQEVVIIDEISMCHGTAMLGYLDFMLRKVRDREDQPFGGLQMIFVGDFAQLPPVEDGKATRPDWAFLSPAWTEGEVEAHELTRVFRQGDQRFIAFLNNIRKGLLTEDDRAYSLDFVRSAETGNPMMPEETHDYTYLVPVNKRAAQLNADALERYPAPTIPIEAEFQIIPGVQSLTNYETKHPDTVKTKLEKAMRLVGKTMFLRIGYPVMFTINDRDGQFVNGTRGFVREINLQYRRKDKSIEDDTEDNIVVGIPATEGEPEQTVRLYRNAYSRDRDQDPSDTINMPAFYNEAHGTKYPPIVSKHPTVHQFPLVPATAITIHKSQGMSMDTAILALSRTFEAGQVYVALSRLRSPDGLVLMEKDFTVQVDNYVTNYYKSIAERREADKINAQNNVNNDQPLI